METKQAVLTRRKGGTFLGKAEVKSPFQRPRDVFQNWRMFYCMVLFWSSQGWSWTSSCTPTCWMCPGTGHRSSLSANTLPCQLNHTYEYPLLTHSAPSASHSRLERANQVSEASPLTNVCQYRHLQILSFLRCPEPYTKNSQKCLFSAPPNAMHCQEEVLWWWSCFTRENLQRSSSLLGQNQKTIWNPPLRRISVSVSLR